MWVDLHVNYLTREPFLHHQQTAFEASFASAFPDTSFSINVSNSKETKMDITFDVPDFGEDPFFDNFKTPTPRTMVFDSTPVSFDDMSATSSSSNKGKKAKSRSALASLSPQSMSAEIEQLDAMAKNISDKSSGGDASLRATRKLRNVKQPVSYAEPSTKSKLRRGVSRLCSSRFYNVFLCCAC